MSAAVAAPDLRGLTDEQIGERLHGGMVDSDLHKQCVLTLQLRNLERQTTASRDLATFTSRLMVATWALVFVSAALLVTSIIQIFERLRAAIYARKSTEEDGVTDKKRSVATGRSSTLASAPRGEVAPPPKNASTSTTGSAGRSSPGVPGSSVS